MTFSFAPGAQALSFEVAESFEPRVAASPDAVGELTLSRVIPGYGDTSPTFVLPFSGGERYDLPSCPSGLYLAIPRLSSGSVEVAVPDPPLSLALTVGLIINWLRARRTKK